MADSQYALDSGVAQTSFNFSRLRDLWVRVSLVGMTGMSELRLKLIDPNGVVAYEATAYYSPSGMQELNLPNSAHPVTVFAAKQVPGGFVLDYGIPVSNSAITRYLTDGDWKLEAVVGDVSYATVLKVTNVF